MRDTYGISPRGLHQVAPRAEELRPFGAIFFADPVPSGVAPRVTLLREPAVGPVARRLHKACPRRTLDQSYGHGASTHYVEQVGFWGIVRPATRELPSCRAVTQERDPIILR